MDKVEESLINGMDFCKDNEDCILRYTRALQNLQQPSTIPRLLKNALHGTRKVSVASMKALRAFSSKELNTTEVQSICKQIFYMRLKPYDSSARTLALDTILESNPSEVVLDQLIHFLLSTDKSYEVKQYLLQRLRMISDSNVEFRNKVKGLIRSESQLNNYHALGQRGLSTAFSRSFSKNGSLLTIQEINGGILKRGIIDVVMSNEGVDHEIFRVRKS